MQPALYGFHDDGSVRLPPLPLTPPAVPSPVDDKSLLTLQYLTKPSPLPAFTADTQCVPRLLSVL
jgi:hypothetical protein